VSFRAFEFFLSPALFTAGIDSPDEKTSGGRGCETTIEIAASEDDHQKDLHHEEGRSHNNSKATRMHEECDDDDNNNIGDNTPFGPSRSLSQIGK
jgi:hypothetical protein